MKTILTIIALGLLAVVLAPFALAAGKSFTHGLAANSVLAKEETKSFAQLVREKRAAGLNQAQAETAALAQIESDEKAGLRKKPTADEILAGVEVAGQSLEAHAKRAVASAGPVAEGTLPAKEREFREPGSTAPAPGVTTEPAKIPVAASVEVVAPSSAVGATEVPAAPAPVEKGRTQKPADK